MNESPTHRRQSHDWGFISKYVETSLVHCRLVNDWRRGSIIYGSNSLRHHSRGLDVTGYEWCGYYPAHT